MTNPQENKNSMQYKLAKTINLPRAVPHRRNSQGKIDPELQKRARDIRLTQTNLDLKSFQQTNIAVVSASINGVLQYFEAANLPRSESGVGEGIHSEQYLLSQLDELKKSGDDIQIRQVYSERTPCSTCMNYLDQECPNVEIFYSVRTFDRHLNHSKAQQLMAAYGLR